MNRLILLVILIYAVHAELRSQDTARINCDIYLDVPPCPENPVEKPGYYILLDQSFQNPSKYWNVSRPYDDNGCVFNFMRNQENVTYPGPAWLWNTNVAIDDCPYSMGEIKTMTVADTSYDTFKSYYFYGTGYFEAKVRQLYCSPGQGSAMWLWCVLDSDDTSLVRPDILDDNEIDVFETQPGDSNSFNIAYHWRKTDDLEKVQNFYRVHMTPHTFTDWTVFAVRWSSERITWFVNNQEIYTMEMDNDPEGCTVGDPDAFYPPNGPFCLRFNSGPNTVGVHDSVVPETLPAHLEIEYARVYKPVGEKASPITLFSGTEGQICITENSQESSQTILKANYYPDASYSWSSPAFEIAPYVFPNFQPQHHSGKVKIWLKPGIQGGRQYPVILNTTVLSHEERDTAWFFVCTEVPPVPQNTFQTSRKAGPLCLYEILHPLENPSTSGCEFFDEASQTWNEAPIRIIGDTRYAVYGTFDPLTYIMIHCRELNACGASEILHSSLTTPIPPPGTCGW